MEAYESIQDRVTQKIRDKQIDYATEAIQAIFAEEPIVIVDLVRSEKLSSSDMDDVRTMFNYIYNDFDRVDIREFVKSFYFGGSYDDFFAEKRAEEQLENSYDNQF